MDSSGMCAIAECSRLMASLSTKWSDSMFVSSMEAYVMFLVRLSFFLTCTYSLSEKSRWALYSFGVYTLCMINNRSFFRLIIAVRILCNWCFINTVCHLGMSVLGCFLIATRRPSLPTTFLWGTLTIS